MKRREFLRGGAALTAVAALPHSALAQTPFTPSPDAWRKFEVTTRVEIVKPAGKVQVWLPLPAVAEPGWTVHMISHFHYDPAWCHAVDPPGVHIHAGQHYRRVRSDVIQLGRRG